MLWSDGQAVLTNCLFSGNSGGAGSRYTIYNHYLGTIKMNNCTVVNNPNAEYAGIITDTYPDGHTNCFISNSIVWGNRSDYPGSLNLFNTVSGNPNGFDVKYSIIGRPSGIYPGTGNLNIDPNLTDTAAGNLTLKTGSPAIDAGSNILYGGLLQSDTALNGVARLVGDSIDIGCYEYTSNAISKGVPGTCAAYTAVLIDNSNNDGWVQLKDEAGNLVAAINANGNNLGLVQYTLYTQIGQPREDAAGNLYLNRNIVIEPAMQPATAVSVRLYVTQEEFQALKNAVNSKGQPSGINNFTDLYFYKNETHICGAAVPTSGSSIAAVVQTFADGYQLQADIPSFSSFYFSRQVSAALPLSWLSFTGSLQGNAVLLDWKTAQEINVSRFTIERSEDGNSFHSLGSIAARGNGLPGHYSYTDNMLTLSARQNFYFRIKETDLDGKSFYSKTIVVSAGNSSIGLTDAYPNPSVNKLTLQFSSGASQKADWSVTDNAGRVVKQGQLNISSGNTTVALPVDDIKGGVYYLTVKCRDFNQVIKFVKQ